CLLPWVGWIASSGVMACHARSEIHAPQGCTLHAQVSPTWHTAITPHRPRRYSPLHHPRNCLHRPRPYPLLGHPTSRHRPPPPPPALHRRFPATFRGAPCPPPPPHPPPRPRMVLEGSRLLSSHPCRREQPHGQRAPGPLALYNPSQNPAGKRRTVPP